MNFEKYRELDTIKLHGISADIFQENEHGELIILYVEKMQTG